MKNKKTQLRNRLISFNWRVLNEKHRGDEN